MRSWLVEIRERQKITRKELSEIVEVDPTHISKIEKSQRDPSVSLAMKIGKILDFEWQKFYEDIEV